ncbi:MAG: T9SS type A sorting domain-containing protein, partial [Chitinophagales bacterium]
GSVILCEFVMTCGTCISAANYLEQIYQDYSASIPGKVKFYAIDWNASFTCSSFQSWATGLSCTLFLNGYDEINYYGGMGMPTVVVLGGTDHKVFYNKLGFNHNTDDQAVRDAIDAALNNTGISETNKILTSLDVFPNPATISASINYFLTTSSDVSLTVLNILGEKTQAINLGQQAAGENHYSLNTQILNSGLYFIQVNTGNKTEVVKLTVMN